MKTEDFSKDIDEYTEIKKDEPDQRSRSFLQEVRYYKFSYHLFQLKMKMTFLCKLKLAIL